MRRAALQSQKEEEIVLYYVEYVAAVELFKQVHSLFQTRTGSIQSILSSSRKKITDIA